MTSFTISLPDTAVQMLETIVEASNLNTPKPVATEQVLSDRIGNMLRNEYAGAKHQIASHKANQEASAVLNGLDLSKPLVGVTAG